MRSSRSGRGGTWALWHVTEAQGMTPYLDEELSKAAPRSLRRIQAQQRRLAGAPPGPKPTLVSPAAKSPGMAVTGISAK